jgi:hypothetical protein
LNDATDITPRNFALAKYCVFLRACRFSTLLSQTGTPQLESRAKQKRAPAINTGARSV